MESQNPDGLPVPMPCGGTGQPPCQPEPAVEEVPTETKPSEPQVDDL
jgi:hypothetical protein